MRGAEMIGHEFKITSSPHETHIIVDGKEVRGVRYFKIEQEVGEEIPTLTLEMLAKSVEVNGVSVVKDGKRPTIKRILEITDDNGAPTGLFAEVDA